MTQPGIEPRSPGPLANTRPMLPVNYSFTNHIFITSMYKQELALNSQQDLKCHKI